MAIRKAAWNIDIQSNTLISADSYAKEDNNWLNLSRSSKKAQ